MTAAGTPESRDVIPRWRPFGSTVRSGETAPLGEPSTPSPPRDLSEHEEAFRRFPGQHTASDLVGAALSSAVHSEAALRAARHLLESPGVSRNAADLADALLSQADGPRPPAIDRDTPHIDFDEVRAKAHRLRRIVRAEPRNAIRWADLALAHTVLGHPEQAEREIRTALAVAGPHRFLLRAAARLYVHMDRPDAAHALLIADPAILDDPWLAAVEVATATLAGTVPKNMKRAQRMLDSSGRYAPWHLAELASQVATTELRAGRVKSAKRLMRLALIQPTDNALAQAEWASANGLGIEPGNLDIPRTYEARALRYSHVGDWQGASRAGLDWLADQPFAQEAAQFTSYVASVGAQDWKAAEHAARIGLVANPDNHMLRNNLAFALANQGRAEEAAQQLQHVPPHMRQPHERAVLNATRGLVMFRRGQIPEGRNAYEQAVAALAALQQLDLAALANVFWAREEVLAGTEEAERVIEAAAGRVKTTHAPEARLWGERLAVLLAGQAAAVLPSMPTAR